MIVNYFKIWRLIVLTMLVFSATPAQAELVVIVNAGVKIEKLSRDDVINIFMGRYRKLSDGSSVQPLDIKGESQERQNFYKKLLDKNLAEINAYWARLIFSGRTTPPAVLDTPSEVLERVAHDPSAIGYIERSSLNTQVKVVYSLPE
jgi:ABC-type phosphate transport system substrate-binding protein